MKPWVKYFIFGLVCYFLFLIVKFPASNAYYFAKAPLADQNIPIKLYGLKGSVWQGSADALIYNGKRFDAVAWEFHPLDLLMAKFAFSVRLKGKDLALKGRVSQSLFGEILLQNVQASVSAMELLALLKIPAVKLDGKFSLNLSSMIMLNNVPTYVQGRLLWSGAESKFPQKLLLGNLYANLSTDDGNIIVALGDGGGPLELSGNLVLDQNGQYDLKGLFAAREGQSSMLGRSLGFVGRYDSTGKIPFNQSGNVSEFKFLVK